MEHYAGTDVSLERSSVCVVDSIGRIVREAKVASEPEALVRLFGQLGLPLTRIGLEAGPLSQWLHAGLTEAGLEAVLLETRHVKAALSAMIVKTDRRTTTSRVWQKASSPSRMRSRSGMSRPSPREDVDLSVPRSSERAMIPSTPAPVLTG